MKVIFVQDVPGIARRGQIRTVSEGYFRNFLHKQNLAKVFDEGSERMMQHQKEHLQEASKQQVSRSHIELEKLRGKSMSIVRAANPAGTLYGAIHENELLKELRKRGLSLKKISIIIPQEIKKIGKYKIHVESRGSRVTLTVEVLPLKKE